MKMFTKQGQAMSWVVLIMGIIIAVIVLMSVLIPVTQDTVDSQNFTGTNLTLGETITTIILLGVLIVVTGIVFFFLKSRGV